MTIFRLILFRMSNVFGKSSEEKDQTRVIFNAPFSSGYHAAYEIMLKNMVEPERPQMTIWWRVACWISMVTRACALIRTHTDKYVILIAFPQQKWFVTV
jgi:hypothetical protein